MKRLVVLLFAAIGISAMAATCVVQRVKVTEIDGDAAYGAEMKNDSGADILNHRFAVAFLDDDGRVLQTVTVEGCLRSLQNGSTNYYSAQSNRDFDEVAVGLSRIQGPLTFGEIAEGEIDLDDIEATRDEGTLVVTGRVDNTGDVDLEDVRVCIIVRDEDGNVQVVEIDNNEFDLDEGDDATFSVTVEVADDTDDTTTVDVVADATNPDEDDDPISPVIEDDIDIEECDDPTATATGTPATATASPTVDPTLTVTATATATPIDDAC